MDPCVSTNPLCVLLAACMCYNLLSFPPAINLNKSLQIPLLTLPFCVSACVLQNHSMRKNSQRVFLSDLPLLITSHISNPT